MGFATLGPEDVGSRFRTSAGAALILKFYEPGIIVFESSCEHLERSLTTPNAWSLSLLEAAIAVAVRSSIAPNDDLRILESSVKYGARKPHGEKVAVCAQVRSRDEAIATVDAWIEDAAGEVFARCAAITIILAPQGA